MNRLASDRIARQFLLRLIALSLGAFPLLLARAGGQALPDPATDAQTINSAAAATAPAATNPAPQEVVYYGYDVVKTYPHDPNAFTQGLLFQDGKLYESTGLSNQSTLREVDLNSGTVQRKWSLPGSYFAEGLALFDGKLYQLTWQNKKAFVYDLNGDPKSFHKAGEFSYTGEGWGLTTDGHWLIMSDGTSTLRFLNPATFAVDHTIQVIKGDMPQDRLNELEYIKGEIYANIWKTDWVARIDPASGRVLGMIDFSYLLPDSDRTDATNVLNGIAYDPAGDRLFITGKNWPKLFEVRLKKK
jgi:glutamine cyclotransferase